MASLLGNWYTGSGKVVHQILSDEESEGWAEKKTGGRVRDACLV